MPSMKPRGHKGGAHCGSKAVAREFEKLSVSKRDSPVRHPSRNRTIRPGQLQKLTQARQMGNRAQFKPTIGDNAMGFPKTVWQDKRPSANLNAHSGQTTPRDGSRDGHRPRPYFAPVPIKTTQMAPPVDRQPKAVRSLVGAAHRPGSTRAVPLEVKTQAQTATFVPFRTVQTFQQPPSRGPSPPPIQQEITLRFHNDEAERQALEIQGDEASQDSWAQGSQESSTPHYNCTPDDNNPIIATKPPPPPSPKSHHRSSISRYTGPVQDTSDSEEEELEAADAAGGASSASNAGEEDMGSALDMTAEDSSDPQSPVFQISSVSLASVNGGGGGGGGLHLPSSTPTPDGRTYVEDESVTMGVTESTETILSAPPRSAGRQASVRSEHVQTERRPARANINKWCPHVVSDRHKRQGSRSMAGETHDQASDYEWLEVLGEGSSGEVTKVRKHIDGWVYAMKKSKKRVVTKAERERALQEVFVLVAIQSPFIVRYYHSFIQDSHLHILMEYCEGESLDRLVAQQRPCCEHYLLCLLWDISRALVHLHDRPGRPMVHLDIKPENIFSVNSLSPYEDGGMHCQDTHDALASMDAMVMADDSQQGSPTVASSPWGQKAAGGGAANVAQSPAYPKPHSAADAGASARPGRLDPMEPRFKLGDCGLVRDADPRSGDDVEEGDRRYLSREFLEGNYDMLPKADIFALGITLYELASGRPLPDGGERLHDLRSGNLDDLPHLSNAFKGLIRKMMHPDPQERPTAEWLAAMAEKELLAKAAETPSAFGRVPRKSGPFSPLESPLAPGGVGLPSPIGMVSAGASPADGTLREQQLERQAQELEQELQRYKQQLADARSQIARLTGTGDGEDVNCDGSNDDDDLASPELSSMRTGRGMCNEDADEQKRQLDFAGAASSPNTSFNSCADMSQEL